MPGIHTIIMRQNIGFLVLRDPEIWDSVFHVMEVEIFCKMMGESAVGSKIHQPGMGQFRSPAHGLSHASAPEPAPRVRTSTRMGPAAPQSPAVLQKRSSAAMGTGNRGRSLAVFGYAEGVLRPQPG